MIFEKKGQVLDLGAGGEWDDVHVLPGSVIYKDNVYYMFYTGFDGSVWKVGLATSPDGVTFTKQGEVFDPALNLAAAYSIYLNMTVCYKDNLFMLYYTGYSGSVWRVGLATSPDGVTFTDKGSVLSIGAVTEWDDTRITAETVIYKDNLFMLYYSGYSGSAWKGGLATSPDGVTFTKQGMVLDKGAGGEWDDVHVLPGSVIYKDNVYYMFYTGFDGSVWKVGLATSPDGVTFTKQGMVLDIGAGGEWDDVHTGIGTGIFKDNLFMLYYSGYSGSVWKGGLAVSNCEPLRIHEWRANSATGTLNFLPGLNDGGDD